MTNELYILQDEAIQAMHEINKNVPHEIKDFWGKVHLANVKVFKAWHELHDVIESNTSNEKKIRLMDKRLRDYSDFIVNTVNCSETQKVLINQLKELFEVIRK